MNSKFNKDIKDKAFEKLLDKIDKDLSIRKKEIAYLKSLLYMDSQENYIDAILRSNIVLLYSHWEGTIKNISIKYLEYVSLVCKDYNFSDLKINFLSLSTMNMFSNIEQDKSFTNINKIITNVINKFNSKVELNIKNNIIKTNSNLSYDVLQNITNQLGINNPIKAQDRNLLDSKIVAVRNSIAHGEYSSTTHRKDIDEIKSSIQDFEEIYEFVIKGIDLFKEEIINSAQNEKYLSNN